MRKRKTRRLLLISFRTAGADKIIGAYIIWFFIAAVPLWIIEPNIHSYGDSLWFCFASATTIGFGDIAAVTPVGRIITVVLSVYSVAVIAIFTAIITGFFMDLARLRTNDSVKAFIDDLENLPELSKEELEALSEKVKNFNKKNR